MVTKRPCWCIISGNEPMRVPTVNWVALNTCVGRSSAAVPPSGPSLPRPAGPPAGAVCAQASQAIVHPACLLGHQEESPFLCLSPHALLPCHHHCLSVGWLSWLLFLTEATPPCSWPPHPLSASPKASPIRSFTALPAWPGVLPLTKTEPILHGRRLPPSLVCHFRSAHQVRRNSAVLRS